MTADPPALAKSKRWTPVAIAGVGCGTLTFACCIAGIIGSALDPPRVDPPISNLGESPALETPSSKSWSGRGPFNSETFRPEKKEWTLQWNATPNRTTGNLIVTVHDPTSPDVPIDFCINEIIETASSGETTVRTTGDVFLKVSATCEWELKASPVR